MRHHSAGINIALKNFDKIPQVIVITSSKEYAAEAFDYNVTGYLLKPVDQEKFLKALVKAKEICDHNCKEDESFFIKTEGRLIKIYPKEILWIEADADYVNIHISISERYTIHSSMKDLEVKLSQNFIRIHRSYIIRIDKVTQVLEEEVKIGDKRIPIGSSYKSSFLSKLKIL